MAAMSKLREIVKVGLVATDANRVLLVKKKGGPSYILPGGKPEKGESDVEALSREICEELGCKLSIASISFLGSFSDVAADLENTMVTIRLYDADLIGEPSPQAEIESIKWFQPNTDKVCLAPSLDNKIIPFLNSRGYFQAKHSFA
jgi:8-oxo-dGTP diphosphatase